MRSSRRRFTPRLSTGPSGAARCEAACARRGCSRRRITRPSRAWRIVTPRASSRCAMRRRLPTPRRSIASCLAPRRSTAARTRRRSRLRRRSSRRTSPRRCGSTPRHQARCRGRAQVGGPAARGIPRRGQRALREGARAGAAEGVLADVDHAALNRSGIGAIGTCAGGSFALMITMSRTPRPPFAAGSAISMSVP